MTTFYTIFYCPIRSAADERISIALLLRSDNHIYFRYSHDKLKIIKELLPIASYHLLKDYLDNCASYVQKLQAEDRVKDVLLNLKSDRSDFFNPGYINYLHVYSNNLIQFSEPKDLSIETDENVYNILYQKFVYESDAVPEQGISIYKEVRKQINPVIEKHVNIDITLTSNEIRNLVVPTKVWFIGRNEVEVTGEIVDFERKTYNLEYEIAKYLHLINALQEANHYPDSTHFIVGREPVKNNQVNHLIWNNVRNLDNISYIPYNELDAIDAYMKKHQVNPYLTGRLTNNEPSF